MRRLFIALLLLPSLVNAQLTISNVRSYILSKTQAQIRPIDIRNVGYITAQYARQADSTATIAVGWGNHSGLYLPIGGGTITGTAGAGFLGVTSQTSNPATPASGIRMFGTSTPAFNFVGTDGFVRTFNNTAITASRTYSFPDASGEVMISGPAQTMAGVKTFSSNISHGGNITPTVNGTRLIGSTSFQYLTTYSRAIIGDNLFVGAQGSTNVTFGYNGGSNISATLFNGGNFLIQNGGTHTNAGYLLDVTGTTRLNGNTTVGGNILFDADLTRSVGSSSNRVQYVFVGSVAKAQAGSGLNFIVDNPGTNTFARFHPTTHNLTLQSAGSAISDDGVNRLQVAGSIKADQFRLSASNTAPSSATDTGTAGEIRITAGFIYYCTATNTWVRAPLSTW